MRSLSPKARDLLDRIRRGEVYNIEHLDFDIEKFNKIKQRSKELLELEETGEEQFKQFPELMQDTFDALYKNNPDLIEEWRIRPDYLLNREIIVKVLESARYKELRVMTQLDELTSALGTQIMGEELLEWMKELKDQLAAQEALSEAVNDILGAQQSDDADDADDADDKKGKKGKGTKKYTLEEAMKLYEEAKAKFDDSINQKRFTQGIERLTAKVKDAVKETSEMISNWGLEQSGSYTMKPVNEKMELLNRLRSSPKLQQIARMAGRYRRLALQTKREKVRKGIDDVYSIKPGNDLARVLPSELMKLKNPVTRKMFIADFIEGKTLNYEIRGKEKKAKGPIIICIDESGSMNGLPEVWSKSVALALLEIAREQKRDFFVIHFSDQRKIEQLHTNEFLKDTPFKVEEMLDMAEHFDNGGTVFEPALDLARKKIGENRTWSKADIIFVTDGESAVTEKWYKDYNEWKKENKVSVYSILIDSGPNTPVVLNLFSDKVEKLSNMKTAADDMAISIFADI